MSGPISILLVDDEEELLELYEMKLESKKHQVSTAIDGNTAISMLNSNKYGLILCDINMPNGNGIDVYEHFNKNNISGSFAFITGHAKGSPELKAAEATGAKVFNKPVNWNDIWELIENINFPSPSVAPIQKASNADTPKPETKKETKTKPVSSPNSDAKNVKDGKNPSSLEKRGLDLIRSINSKKK